MIKENFQKARVLSIEPIKPVFSLLEKNLSSLFSDIEFLEVALSDFEGSISMHFDPHNTLSTEVIEDGLSNVMATTLDNLIVENGIDSIDILKLDVEKHELEVLCGASKALEITRYLFLEITLTDNEKYTFTELCSALYVPGVFNFQLIHSRNYSDSSEGFPQIMDCVFVNKLLS